MGKQGAPNEKTKPGIKKDADAPAAPAGEHKGGGPSHGGGHSSSGSGKVSGAKVGCLATGCKEKDVRASFCQEHFRQFKFGLITRTGQMVSDYERKLEHYQEWLKTQQQPAKKTA